MSDSSYRFTHAITRKPSPAVIEGLRAVDVGSPSFEQMLKDHEHYIATLKEAGATVHELPALDDYPDAVFVEDAALCLAKGAILMRPSAPTRSGEVAHMAATLKSLYSDVREIKNGFIEGGDILITGREILVGRSERTDASGVAELRELVTDWGYTVREVMTPEGVLHFKTDCSLLSPDTILSTKRLAASGCFADYNVVYTKEGEEASANAIRFNDVVIMAAGFPNTAAVLRELGYEVKEINNSECSKIDGGMSCLSLRLPL
jgi:dimethylargininase